MSLISSLHNFYVIIAIICCLLCPLSSANLLSSTTPEDLKATVVKLPLEKPSLENDQLNKVSNNGFSVDQIFQ